MVLYERLGVLSFKQIYWDVNGGVGSRRRGKEHCTLPPCSLPQHTLPGLARGERTRPPVPFVLPVPSLTPGFQHRAFLKAPHKSIRGWVLHPKQSCYPHPHSIRVWKRGESTFFMSLLPPKTLLLWLSCKPERRSDGAAEPGQRWLQAAPSTKPGCPKTHGSTPATSLAQGP